MKCLIAASVLLCTAVHALAQAPHPPAPPCLRGFQVRDFKKIDNHTLIVTADVQRQYKLTFMDACPDAGAYSTLIIKTQAPGALACVAHGDYVLVKTYGGPPDRCTVKSVEYYPPPPLRDDNRG